MIAKVFSKPFYIKQTNSRTMNKIPPKYLPYIDNLIETFNSTTFDDKCSDLNEN